MTDSCRATFTVHTASQWSQFFGERLISQGLQYLDILNLLYCNVVLWGYLKMLHERTARTTEQLKICITDAAEDTSPKVTLDVSINQVKETRHT